MFCGLPKCFWLRALEYLVGSTRESRCTQTSYHTNPITIQDWVWYRKTGNSDVSSFQFWKIMFVDRFANLQRTGSLGEYETRGISIRRIYDQQQRKLWARDMSSYRNGKAGMTQMNKIWRYRNITNRTKVHLIRTLVFSIFLYGAELWTLKAADKRRTDAFEMWCWWRMLRIPWTAFRSNVSILKQLKLEKSPRLSTICLHRVLEYFGHEEKTLWQHGEISGNGQGQG